jgi:hypothetical protein
MGGVVTITSQATLKKIAFQRTSVLQDVVDVAESMRPEDAAELYAVSGDTPKGGLLSKKQAMYDNG